MQRLNTLSIAENYSAILTFPGLNHIGNSLIAFPPRSNLSQSDLFNTLYILRVCLHNPYQARDIQSFLKPPTRFEPPFQEDYFPYELYTPLFDHFYRKYREQKGASPGFMVDQCLGTMRSLLTVKQWNYIYAFFTTDLSEFNRSSQQIQTRERKEASSP